MEGRENDVLAAFESGKLAVQVTSKGDVQSDSKLGTDQDQEPILFTTGSARPEHHFKKESSLEGIGSFNGDDKHFGAELAQLRLK